MLHVDIPTDDDIVHLARERGDIAVSIYLPTTPLTQDALADRIALKNMAGEALAQLEARGADRRRMAALAEQLDDLQDDDEFWRLQAHGLALFVSPEKLRSFRLANRLQPVLMVADRFHLKPLLRAVTFAHNAFVLALAENAVRVIEVSGDLPAAPVRLPDLPKDAASVARKATLASRSPSGRIQGSEGRKVRLRQYARRVDGALRDLLAGQHVPLILATTDTLDALFRSVCSYPYLVQERIAGNPETTPDHALAAAARPLLDRLHARELAGWHERFERYGRDRRTTTDIAAAARAATFGAVESLLVDMDQVVHGTIDEASGAVTFADGAGADSYGVVDEIARRALLAGGTVWAVRHADIPGGRGLAALLRYPV